MGGIQKPCNQISLIETACVLDLFVFSIIKVCCKAQMNRDFQVFCNDT